MVDFKPFAGFITFEYCCWNKLLTANSTCWIAWGTLSFMMLSFGFYNIFVVMDCVPIIFSSLVSFLKDIMGSVLKVSLQFWFVCNMCQSFVRISFIFGNARLYVTDNVTHWLSQRFCWWNSQLSKFAVWQHLFCIPYQKIVQ